MIALGVSLLAACGGGKEAQESFIVWNGANIEPDAAVARAADRRPLSYRLLGARAPDIGSGDDALGNGWVLIDFWGMWCPDCLADAPYAAELAAAVEAHPHLAFLSVHTPPSRARASEAFGRWGSVERYMTETGHSYPVVVDADASVREAYRIDWTPTYLLIGPDRIIRAFRTDLGDTPAASIIAEIETIITGTPG